MSFILFITYIVFYTYFLIYRIRESIEYKVKSGSEMSLLQRYRSIINMFKEQISVHSTGNSKHERIELWPIRGLQMSNENKIEF